MKVMMKPIVVVALSTVTKGTGGFGNNKKSGDHPNGSMVEISQNTKNSPGDFLSHRLQKKTII